MKKITDFLSVMTSFVISIGCSICSGMAVSNRMPSVALIFSVANGVLVIMMIATAWSMHSENKQKNLGDYDIKMSLDTSKSVDSVMAFNHSLNIFDEARRILNESRRAQELYGNGVQQTTSTVGISPMESYALRYKKQMETKKIDEEKESEPLPSRYDLLTENKG